MAKRAEETVYQTQDVGKIRFLRMCGICGRNSLATVLWAQVRRPRLLLQERIAAMAVCDDLKRIRYMKCGAPGCSQLFFGPDEYLLCYSGYSVSRTMCLATRS